MEVLLFGGTLEGRLLVEWLAGRGTCSVVACTATEYGARLVCDLERVTTVRGPLLRDDLWRLVETHAFACIVDATHPYAQRISASVDELARERGLEVVRVLREECDEDVGTCFPDASSAARHLATTTGNVLLTTGSKDLPTFVRALPDYAERLYARILPVRSSLAVAEGLGVPASHIVAMQGPFSARLNEALVRELDIRHMVTKRSGRAGGFDQKVEAARNCGIDLVVIARPPQRAGVSLEEAQALLEVRYGL